MLDKEISIRYVLQENIPTIRESLQKTSQSEAMRKADTPKAVADVLSKALERHDKNFSVHWRDPNASQDQPKYEGWFTKLSRKTQALHGLKS